MSSTKSCQVFTLLFVCTLHPPFLVSSMGEMARLHVGITESHQIQNAYSYMWIIENVQSYLTLLEAVQHFLHVFNISTTSGLDIGPLICMIILVSHCLHTSIFWFLALFFLVLRKGTFCSAAIIIWYVCLLHCELLKRIKDKRHESRYHHQKDVCETYSSIISLHKRNNVLHHITLIFILSWAYLLGSYTV